MLEKPEIIFLGLPGDRSVYDALAHPQYIGYRYLTSLLRKQGYSVKIANIFIERSELEDVLFSIRPENVREKISSIVIRKTLSVVHSLNKRRSIIGFNISCGQTDLVIEVAMAIKHRYPDVTIVAGGVHATLCCSDLLTNHPQIDHILYGEAEKSIVHYMDALCCKASVNDIQGLAYRSPDGQVVINQPAPVERDLDNLLPPALDDISLVCQRNSNLYRISSCRGCHGRCSFCSIYASNKCGHSLFFRSRSAANVVDEIEHIKKVYGINRFVFVDPDFIGYGKESNERLGDFVRELKSRKLDIRFKIDCRADNVRQDTMALLKAVGLYAVEIGIESFNDNILKIFRKNITRQQNMKALHCLRQMKLQINMDYLFYTPWTTMSMLRDQLALLKMLARLPMLHLFPVFRALKIIPNTDIFNLARTDCTVCKNNWEYDYEIKDHVVQSIFTRHMLFCQKAYALYLNSPRVEQNTYLANESEKELLKY